MFGHNFGLFGSYKRAKKLLKDMYKITTDDALIIAMTMNPYMTNSAIHARYQKANLKKGRMGGQIRIRVRFESYIGDWFDYLFVSKNEMKDIVSGTGWKVKKFISERQHYAAILEKQ
jgi:hypothetical protein